MELFTISPIFGQNRKFEQIISLQEAQVTLLTLNNTYAALLTLNNNLTLPDSKKKHKNLVLSNLLHGIGMTVEQEEVFFNEPYQWKALEKTFSLIWLLIRLSFKITELRFSLFSLHIKKYSRYVTILNKDWFLP